MFICKHCDKVYRCNRGRGLCATCYYTPEIKVLYPPGNTNGSGRRSEWADRNPVRPAAYPTSHPPGTFGKMDVMAERAMRGESLFHPHDADFGVNKPVLEELLEDDE